ncbi:MAG: helix-turn-helix transcriptional regulator [Clostridia bacterium]|nr:helix-turn-helix transcriptional regulator [Clostridia bacterium]
MARNSTNPNKSIYWKAREEAGLTRAAASEALQFISESRLEKIESGSTAITPEDVLVMEKTYRKPGLCNHYCAEECPIGRESVPHIEVKDLSKIVLEMLATLNALNRQKDRLIEITEDGVINDEELGDFLEIQDKLEKISIVASTMRLWIDNAVANGNIDTLKINMFQSNDNLQS